MRRFVDWMARAGVIVTVVFALAADGVAAESASAIGVGAPQECAPIPLGRSSVRVAYDAKGALVDGGGVVVFERSDGGTLSATDGASGAALWTFQPPELAEAHVDAGLMTDLAVLRFDVNNDGLIDAGSGDRVWLYFGLKRGGPHYYALDVTDRTPRPLWHIGADTLEGLADAWSTPTVARVRIAGAAQNGEHFVLVIGGGYARRRRADVRAEAGRCVNAARRLGNRLFMVDAATGRLLWSAGNEAGVSLTLEQMTHAIPAQVTALDLDGDEFADRLYAADVGGRIWRFDIWNGLAPADLVTGGVFASLGAAAPRPEPAVASDARQFFNAPDVALMQPRGADPWFNISIGSGNGADARTTDVHDRFYSLRDREPFVKRTQSDYDEAQPLFDATLTNVSPSAGSAQVPDGSPGWKLDLTLNGLNSGEKVLAESLTANGVVLFTTYQPAIAAKESCDANGTSRVYAVRVDTGSAALDLNDDAKVTEEDLSSTLAQPAVGVEPRIELVMPVAHPPDTSPNGPDTPGTPDVPPANAAASSTRCFVGAELMTRCVPLGTVLRTFWKRTTVN